MEYVHYLIPALQIVVGICAPFLVGILWRIMDNMKSMNTNIILLLERDRNNKALLDDHELRLRKLEYGNE